MTEVLTQVTFFNTIRPDAVSVGNLGLLQVVKEHRLLPIHGDFPLNIYDSEAVNFLLACGVVSITLSQELNFNQITKLLANSSAEVECLVHGNLTLMVSQYCAVGSFLGQLPEKSCAKVCATSKYFLKDRRNEQFPLYTDQYCRMHILNAKELDITGHIGKFKELVINRIRIEGKQMDNREISKKTELYRGLIDRNTKAMIGENVPNNITRGHYFRGVQ